MSIITSVFGTHSEREVKRINPIVDKVMSLDEEFSNLSDAEINISIAADGKTTISEKVNTLDDEYLELYIDDKYIQFHLVLQGIQHL